MKSLPIGLMTSALLLWGWQTDFLIFAAILAILLESSRFIRTRFEFSVGYFKWISDLCTVLMLGTAMYLFFNHTADQFVYILLRYFPVIVSPMLLAQSYSTSDKIDIRAVSLASRRSGKNAKPLYIRLEYPFLVLTLISASFAPEKNMLFYPILVLIAACGLYNVRNRRYSAAAWFGCFLVLAILGFAASVGLNRLQLLLEKHGVEWFSGIDLSDSDPFRSVTAIGNIGKLKASNRIAFRVRPEYPHQLPILLKEAVYDLLYKNDWFATQPEFTQIRPSENKTWILGVPPQNPRRITVLGSFRRGKGLLKLPSGTAHIRNLPVEEMKRNRLGAVSVEGIPGYAEYQVEYGENNMPENAPSETDIQIPEYNKPVLKEISDKLHLQKLSPKESVRHLENFFETNFAYSLKNFQKDTHPINRFLRTARSGHCEYFATAGVLLLRYVGIPARYAVGFSVHEWNDMEKQALVRTRHAHAWTRAWIDDRWIDIDFTPSVWRDSENESISGWYRLTDIWDYAIFLVRAWKWQKTDRNLYAFCFVAVLVVLGRRLLLLKKKTEVKRMITANNDSPAQAHTDSPFDNVTKLLQQKGYVRMSTEPLKQWIYRIRNEGDLQSEASVLALLADIHYRFRFDPKGITREEYQSLEQGSRKWCAKNELYMLTRGEHPDNPLKIL